VSAPVEQTTNEAPPGPMEAATPDGATPEGERTKRPRRRGRRGKDGRDGKPDGPQQAAPQNRDSNAAPVRRAELEPQAQQRLGETFAHVTSEGYDEDATPTDEELRALEESAQAESARAQDGDPSTEGSGAAVDGAAPQDVAPDAERAERAEPDDGGDAHGEAAPAAGRDAARGAVDRRQLAPERDAPKLQKVLAQSGAGSRRDIEQWIVEGRVTVNGEKAHTGQRVSFGDRVAVDNKPVRIRIAPLPARVIAYHKPVGEIVTHDDPQQRPTVFRKLPRLFQGKWQSVGRLDINTEGLLLFTNSGELANQLMHPRFGIEREYAVRVLGALDDASRARLLEGVDVEGQRAAFLAIDEGNGDGANRWYRVTIAEGRHREVRRLFDAVGLAVSRLIRIRYGAVVLPRGLKRGVWVDLPEGDVKALRRLVGHGDRSDRGDRGERSDRGDRVDRGGDDARGSKGRRGRGRGPSSPQPPRLAQDPRANVDHNNRPPFDPRPPKGRGGDRQANRGPRKGQPQQGGGEGAIPNPLMQTYDRRAGQEANRVPQRDYGDDGPIPNPLQQNFDKRAIREANRMPRREYGDEGPIPNPLQQTFDKRQVQERGDPLALGRRDQPRRGAQGGQPDPMKTAVGYIGADAFHTKMSQGRGNNKGSGRRRR
jgi:23S rRNA pseudouridine2605 synthase